VATGDCRQTAFSPFEGQVSMLKPGCVLPRRQQVLQHAQRLRHKAVQVALAGYQELQVAGRGERGRAGISAG
jgi:hypothetical protein